MQKANGLWNGVLLDAPDSGLLSAICVGVDTGPEFWPYRSRPSREVSILSGEKQVSHDLQMRLNLIVDIVGLYEASIFLVYHVEMDFRNFESINHMSI
jgi:hypothetical protein